MTEVSTDGYVVSSTLLLEELWDRASLWKTLDDHRFMTQHQLSIAATTPISGSLQVKLLQDTGQFVVQPSVDTTLSMTFASVNSGLLVFTGILRGLELIEITPLSAGAILTIVLSSTRNQG